MIKLTNEEKKIKEFFENFVDKKSIFKPSKEKILEFCDEYVRLTLKNTKYENERIDLSEEYNPKTRGNIQTGRNGEASKLKLNLDMLIDKKGFNSSNSNARFAAAFQLFRTLNHEIQHYFQGKGIENYKINTKGMTLSECINITQENLARRTDPDKFYSFEEGNYEDIYIEGDARRAGTIKTATQLFRIYPKMSQARNEYLINKVIDSIKDDNVEFNDLKYDSSRAKYSRYDVTSAYVDELISAKPQILKDKKFSILNLEYDKDGTRFDFDEIVKRKNKELKALANNSKITEETRKNIRRQVNAGFSMILYNSLKRSTDNIIELRRRMGDDVFLKEIDFVINGKKNEINEQFSKYKKYGDFFEQNKDKLNSKLKQEAIKELDNLYKRSNYYTVIDKRTGEKIYNFDNKEIKFLNKVKSDVEKTYNKYPKYFTREQLLESNKKMQAEKEDFKQQKIDKFSQRRFEQIRKAEMEKKEKERKILMEHKRKMKNPLYRISYNIRKRIENSKKEKLPSSQKSFDKKILEEKRDEVEKLTTTKNELQERYNNIKLESEDILRKAESKLIAENKEKKVEEKDIGKQI